MTWATDVSAADWIRPRLNPFLTDTGSVVPNGFDAYARLLHPVDYGDGTRERWSQVAARNGRVTHPEMQLHAISTPSGSVPGRATPAGYHSGSLAAPERTRLIEHLRPFTSTPCWFAVWEGFGYCDDEGITARVELPHRAYLLTQGPLDRAVESFAETPFDQSPNLWWPEDRSWFVATEIDYAWTYVAGRLALIEEVLADDVLEALPARLQDLPFFDSDRINV